MYRKFTIKALLGNDETKPVCGDKSHPTTSNFRANKNRLHGSIIIVATTRGMIFSEKKENGIANTLMEICQRTCRGC